MRRNLRSIVGSERSNRSAISLLVYPSIFATATAQSLIVQGGEQAAVLLGNQGGLLRRWIGSRQAIEVARCGTHATAPLVSPFAVNQVDGFALGDHKEQPPQLVAVGQLRETPLFHAAEEAIEGTQGNVFFVGLAARGAANFWRARMTRRWKYRCQRGWAAVPSPARRRASQAVILPGDDTGIGHLMSWRVQMDSAFLHLKLAKCKDLPMVGTDRSRDIQAIGDSGVAPICIIHESTLNPSPHNRNFSR